MFSGSLASILFSLSIGFIFLQIVIFLIAVFKKKKGLIVLMLFTTFFSIISMSGLGVYMLIEKSLAEKERTAEEQALYNHEIAEKIDINDFDTADWETIIRAANGDYTVYYPLLVKIFEDDPETLTKIESYGNALQIKGLLTEVAELRAAPITYFLKYDGQLHEELSKTGEHYRDVATNLENINLLQDENYQALYNATTTLMTDLSTGGGDVFTVLEKDLASIEKLDITALYALYEKYNGLLKDNEETIITNEEKIQQHFQSITTDFEEDIKKALETK